MEYLQFWQLLGLKLEIDFEKRHYTLIIGPLVIKEIPFDSFKALNKNHHLIEDILREHFIDRGVMWFDFRGEVVTKCINSLKDLKEKNLTRRQEFVATKKSGDEIFATILQAWASECEEAAEQLEGALEDEKDPSNTGMDISAKKQIPDVLGKFRKTTYPFVALFIDLLPDGNAVKEKAKERLNSGKDLLIRHYNVSSAEIVSPDWQM